MCDLRMVLIIKILGKELLLAVASYQRKLRLLGKLQSMKVT